MHWNVSSGGYEYELPGATGIHTIVKELDIFDTFKKDSMDEDVLRM